MHLFNKLILILLVGLIMSCKSGRPEKNLRLISVSILPQKYFIERIAGDDFQVNVLIPPGASPATYEPTPMQMKNVARSSYYFRIGHVPFENAWFDNLLQAAGEIKVVDLSQNIRLIRGLAVKHGDHYHEGGIDPHIWSSPKTVKLIVGNLYRALVEIEPGKKNEYEKNYLQFLAELDQLDKQTELVFSNVRNKSFMIFHPALSYLARDYGLNQISVELDGKEPSPTHMKELVKKAREVGITKVLVQKQFNMENARAIASEIEGEVISIDPLAEDWLAEMQRIISILKD